MDVVAAWTATVKAFSEVFAWKTGGRTRDQNTLRSEAEEAHRAYMEAEGRADLDGRIAALIQLRKLRDEARAKSGR